MNILDQEEFERALTEGNVEYLFGVWKTSLADKKGQEVRDLITENLDVVTDALGLNKVDTFRELVDVYDYGKVYNALSSRDFYLVRRLVREPKTTKNAKLLLDILLHSDLHLGQYHAGVMFYLLISKLGIFPEFMLYIMTYNTLATKEERENSKSARDPSKAFMQGLVDEMYRDDWYSVILKITKEFLNRKMDITLILNQLNPSVIKRLREDIPDLDR